MHKILFILIFVTIQSNLTFGQERTGYDFEREPIDIEAEKPERNERHYERGERNVDRYEKKQKEEQERKKREAELKRIKSEKERQLKILKAKNNIFEALTYTPRQNLKQEKIMLSKFENLNITYIQEVANSLNKLNLKRELLKDIDSEITKLKTDISNYNLQLRNRGDISIMISSMCDKLIDLFSFSSDFTGSGVAATRIKFVNDLLKEYVRNEKLTSQWIFDHIYNYSSSNYMKNTQKSLMKSIEGLYSISKLMKELEENKRGFNKLQKQTKRELQKLEKTYLKYYEEYKTLQKEFIEIPMFDIYIKKNIKVAKLKIELCQIQIDEIKEQLN